MTITQTLAGVFATAALFGAASAQDRLGAAFEADGAGEIYVGGGYSLLSLEGRSDTPAFDGGGDEISALSARVGYQITPVFAAELEGTLGLDDGAFGIDPAAAGADLGIPGIASAQGELGLDYLAGVFVRGAFPLTDRISLSGRVGYAYAEFDNAAIVDLGDGDIRLGLGGADDGVAFGGSARYDVTPLDAIRASYTRYNFSVAEVDAFTLSYQRTFGR